MRKLWPLPKKDRIEIKHARQFIGVLGERNAAWIETNIRKFAPKWVLFVMESRLIPMTVKYYVNDNYLQSKVEWYTKNHNRATGDITFHIKLFIRGKLVAKRRNSTNYSPYL